MKENTGTHGDNRLNEMQIDAIGEIMNISMGSAATALSSMLDKQVLITTPKYASLMWRVLTTLFLSRQCL